MKAKSIKAMAKRTLTLLLVAALFSTSVDTGVLAAEPTIPFGEEQSETQVGNEDPDETEDSGEIGNDTQNSSDQDGGTQDLPELGDKKEDAQSPSEEDGTTEKQGGATPEEESADDASSENPEEAEVKEDELEEAEAEEDEAEEDKAEENGEQIIEDGLETDNIKVTGSFGSLFEDALNSDVEAEEEEYTGCNVIDIEMNGDLATVSFQTLVDATLVVGVYDDDGVKMLGSGSVEVSAGDTLADVTIAIESMPADFYLKAYLVDTVSLRPLSSVYCNEDYTQAMKEFLSHEKADFAPERIFSLDSSADNNFMVFQDAVKIIKDVDEEGNAVNDVVEADDTTYTYIINNIGDDVKSLSVDDIFAYQYGENQLLVTRVAKIEIADETATIHGGKLSFDEVFSYIRINTQNVNDGAEEAYSYDEGISLMSDGVDSISPKWEQTIEKDSDEGWTTSVTVAITPSLSIYYMEGKDEKIWNFKQVSLELQSEVSGEFSFGEEFEKTIPLAENIEIPLIGAWGADLIALQVDVGIHIDADVSISSGFTLSGGSLGIQVLRKGGVQNISKSPTLELDNFSIAGSLSLGFLVSPSLVVCSISAIDFALMALSMEAELGGEVTAAWTNSVTLGESERHVCIACIDGDINLYFSLTIDGQILGEVLAEKSFTSFENKLSTKIGDFYYSLDYNEFGWGKECPHLEYKVAVTVLDKEGTPVQGASVNNNEGNTNKKGKVSIWLPAGKQTVYALKEGAGTGSVSVNVDGPQSVTVKLGVIVQPQNDKAVKQFCTNYHTSAAVTKDGSLYMWGYNGYSQLCNGTTNNSKVPVKIPNLDNVEYFTMDRNVCAAITKDGSLYMWGRNDYGQVGNGTTVTQKTPCKILDNVKTVCVSDATSAAIRKDGSLYMWGSNNAGQLGYKTEETYSSTPERVSGIDSVRSVCISHNAVGAVTTSGDLYMWGSDNFSRLGRPAGEDTSGLEVPEPEPYQPVKVEIGSVKYFEVNKLNSMALLEDGSLYMWGLGEFGRLGNGTTETSATPVQVSNLNGVTQAGLSKMQGGWSWAITEDGSLYMWGHNEQGQLGNGSTSDMDVPVKVELPGKATMAEAVRPGSCNSAALTEDHVLYLWGGGYDSQPQKVLGGVAFFGMGGDVGTTYGAVTMDGCLYMWGDNGEYAAGGELSSVTTPTLVTFPADEASGGGSSRSVSSLSEESELLAVEEQPELGNPVITPGEDNPARGMASFSGLETDQEYNFYAMKSKDAENRLGSDNLLYITQAVSDNNGTITIQYELCREPDNNTRYFIVSKKQLDIARAEAVVDPLIYNEEEQYPQVTVTYDGVLLSEDVDYKLYGALAVTEPGDYSVTIRGIGKYFGEKSVTYQILTENDPDDPDNPTDPDNPVNPDDPDNPTDPDDPDDPDNPTDPDDPGNPDDPSRRYADGWENSRRTLDRRTGPGGISLYRKSYQAAGRDRLPCL